MGVCYPASYNQNATLVLVTKFKGMICLKMFILYHFERIIHILASPLPLWNLKGKYLKETFCLLRLKLGERRLF